MKKARVETQAFFFSGSLTSAEKRSHLTNFLSRDIESKDTI